MSEKVFKDLDMVWEGINTMLADVPDSEQPEAILCVKAKNQGEEGYEVDLAYKGYLDEHTITIALARLLVNLQHGGMDADVIISDLKEAYEFLLKSDRELEAVEVAQ